MSESVLQEALGLAEQWAAVASGQKLEREYARRFDPERPHEIGVYGWQAGFHNAGADCSERALIAANRVGKTSTAAAECAMHLTGQYPDWWQGRRFDEPIRCWIGSETTETQVDITQAAMLGDLSRNQMGTGWIPRDAIVTESLSKRRAGVADVVRSVGVRHSSGGVSLLQFKTYEQGPKKWMGTSRHVVWYDEEPPLSIYTEGQTRTLDVAGITLVTFTPLQGPSNVVIKLLEGGPGVYVTNVSWDDAPHLDDDEKARLISSYPEHERATRSSGTPLMGSGSVYAVSDDLIMCDPMPLPPHFRRIIGLDIGWDHPTAAAAIAYDGDRDCVYVYDSYKARRTTIADNATAIRNQLQGDKIPIAWPHDALQTDKQSGARFADLYRAQGLNMLGMSARYTNDSGGGQPTEPIVYDLLDRMRSGRFKVFRDQTDWLAEKRLYRREDGKIVRERDDLLSATHYAVMMLRFARTMESRRPLQSQTAGYDPLDSDL